MHLNVLICTLINVKRTKYTLMYVKVPISTLACTWNAPTVQCNVHEQGQMYIDLSEIV